MKIDFYHRINKENIDTWIAHSHFWNRIFSSGKRLVSEFCNISRERIDHKNKSLLASRIMVNTCFESSWLHFVTSYSSQYSVLLFEVFQKRRKKLSQGRRLSRRFYDSGSHTDDIVIFMLFGERCRLYFILCLKYLGFFCGIIRISVISSLSIFKNISRIV